MSKQTAIRLPDDVYIRLQSLSERTGRTKTFYIKQAIEEHLDELEDLYLAQKISAKIKSGKASTFSLDEVERELGLDD